jgi:hypothetical protein
MKKDGLLGFVLPEQKKRGRKLDAEQYDHEKSGYAVDQPGSHVLISPLSKVLILDIGHSPLRFAHHNPAP